MENLDKLLGEYKLVLGLEIHLHLKTRYKMFCRCEADIYGKPSNTYTCPTCLGLPGALPVPNLEAVKKAQLLALALNCTINKNSRFDRKHYNYPDLPKGYQISQYHQPLSINGFLDLSSGQKIEIERVHLEEDTAKSFHKDGKTLIDFNKSSIPLVEIVTRPKFTTIDDAVEFSKQIQDIVRTLQVGDVDMEKGQMRLEANISLRTNEMERQDELPKYKVEIKNINSFKFMEKAVRAEILRQKKLLDAGEQPIQENRGFDEDKNITVSQRTKEHAHDYRYFPEPDIPPMEFDDAYIEELKAGLSELPAQAEERLIKQYAISEKLAKSLTSGTGLLLLEKFESLVSENLNPESVANTLVNKPETREMPNEEFVQNLLSKEDTIDDEILLKELIGKVLAKNKNAFDDLKSGRSGAAEYLLGQVMKESKGKANPSKARKLIVESIK